ncbi:MAG: serine hydrolase, partial [Gemmatimonadota bacterium]
VKRVTGKSLAEFSVEELFKPLGMTHTTWRDDYRRVVPGRATAYAPVQGGWVQDMPFTMVYGNGGLLSTMGDLMIWNDALSTGKIPGGKPVVALLEAQAKLNDGTPISYALGLTHDDYHGVHEIGHGGATAGYRTYVARWPERGLSVAVFCNAASADPGRYARQVADVVLGLPTETRPPVPAVTVAAADLDPLVGSYRDSTTDQMMIFAVRDGKPSMSFGGPWAELTPLGGGRFWSRNAGDFRFEKEGSGWRLLRTADGVKTFTRAAAFDTAAVPGADYAGTYRSDELDLNYVIRYQDGRLELLNAYRAPLKLVPFYRDGFRAGPMTVRFVRDGSDRVAGARMFAGRALDVRFDRVP